MAASSSLVNPGDSSLFFNHDILGERKISQCRGLPLARTQRPLRKPLSAFRVASFALRTGTTTQVKELIG